MGKHFDWTEIATPVILSSRYLSMTLYKGIQQNHNCTSSPSVYDYVIWVTRMLMNALWSWGQREMPHGTVHSPVSLLIRKQLQYSYDHITFFFATLNMNM